MEEEKKREMTHNRKTRGSKPHPIKFAGETPAVRKLRAGHLRYRSGHGGQEFFVG